MNTTPRPESDFAEHELPDEGDYDTPRELLEAFAKQYRSGAQGCSMDADAAQAVANAIDLMFFDRDIGEPLGD